MAKRYSQPIRVAPDLPVVRPLTIDEVLDGARPTDHTAAALWLQLRRELWAAEHCGDFDVRRTLTMTNLQRAQWDADRRVWADGVFRS
jgi:hypothetical protein